jgi:hypothetical protein
MGAWIFQPVQPKTRAEKMKKLYKGLVKRSQAQSGLDCDLLNSIHALGPTHQS